jgi:hypothetical protein
MNKPVINMILHQQMYSITSLFFSAQDQKNEIQDGIDDYNKYTCVNFRSANKRDEGVKRLLFANGDGCRSYVGMQGGDQAIELAPLCRAVRSFMPPLDSWTFCGYVRAAGRQM